MPGDTIQGRNVPVASSAVEKSSLCLRLHIRTFEALRMWSHSTCSHFKSKILKSLLNTKLPKVTRIKKQFQNQPSNAISVERLLSKVKPRSIVYLQKPENTCMNIVHTLVFQARVVWRARCWLESLHKATWLYL